MPRGDRDTGRQLRNTNRALERLTRVLQRTSGGVTAGGAAGLAGGGVGGLGIAAMLTRAFGPLGAAIGLLGGALADEARASIARTVANRQVAASLGVSASEFADVAGRLRELGVSEGGIQAAVAEGAFIARGTGLPLDAAVEQVRSRLAADPFVAAQLGFGELVATGGEPLGPGRGFRTRPADIGRALEVNAAAVRALLQRERAAARLIPPIPGGAAPIDTTNMAGF